MRSLEKSHRNTDMDQVNPEHANREAMDFSWDDLNKVPFSGNRQQSPKNTADIAEDLKNMVNNSLADDEIIQSKREEEARQRVQDIFQKIDSIGSFGKNARTVNRLSSKEEFEKKSREDAKDNTVF